MLKWLVIFLISGFFIYCGWADVVITELSGTNNAEYGTSHSLQCSYDFSNETGVEIKWFYNGDDQIFLWVPNLTKPNAIDTWKSVLDTNDTNDHDITHSVINFKELDFNLTGYYTCKVTGDEHEATKTERMIVYRPASFIEFDLVSEENDTIILKCAVFDVYPLPNITVTGLYLEKNGSVVVYSEKGSVYQEALYNATKTFIIKKNELISPALIELSCNIAIAETNYNLTKTLEYISGYETTTTENSEFYPNDTTILPENEIKSTLANTKDQGGTAVLTLAPYKWKLILLSLLLCGRHWMV